MLRAMADAVEIGVCPAEQLRPALEMVLRTLPAQQRAPLVDSLAKLRREPLGAFEALVVAQQAGKLLAAAWGQPQPGKSCSLWPPQADRGETPAPLAEALIARAVSIADAAGISVTQSLAETSNDPLHVPLTQCGFEMIAELRYLQWKPTRTHPAPSPGEFVFEPFDPRDQARLQRVALSTYGHTLDFPELDGMRNIRDVISGYRCVGEFQQELWTYITRDGQDVGVLLLSEHPDTKQLELVYMGIVPEARGLGLGALAVSRAQSVTLQRRLERMVLAVDARNKPAQAIYRRAGFRVWAQRYAYLRPRAK